MKTLIMKWKNTLSALVLTLMFGGQTNAALIHDPEAGTENLMELRFSETKCSVREYANPILYTAKNENLNYYFLVDGFSFRQSGNEYKPGNPMVQTNNYQNSAEQVILSWVGMNGNAEIVGAEEMRALSSVSRTKNKSIDCINRSFRKLFYNQLYPGIDLMYTDHEDQLELNLTVKPGFDYANARFQIKGAKDLRLEKDGSLVIETSNGSVYFERPLAHQDGKPVRISWKILNDEVGFDIKNTNPDKELRIQSMLSTMSAEI